MFQSYFENISELTSDTLETFRNSFSKDPKNLFAQNVVSRSDPLETCLQRKTLETTNHVYSHKVNFYNRFEIYFVVFTIMTVNDPSSLLLCLL